MAGLLGFDPAELAVAAGLLSAKKGSSPADLFLNYAQMLDQRKRQEEREKLLKLQTEQGQLGLEQTRMQMDQMRQNREMQERLRQAAGDAFRPPQEAAGPTPDGGPLMLPGGGGMSQFVQSAMQIDPMEGMKWQQAMAKQRNIKDVAPGATLFDVDNNRPLFQAPQKTPDWMDPRYQEFQLRKAREGATRVRVNNAQETEFNKKVGGHFAEQFNNLLTGASAANNQLKDLQRFENIVSKVPTGKLEPLKAEVLRLGSSLGVKFDAEKMKTMGFQEALESMSNQFALTLRNPEGGAGMPGALSDKDREFLVSMVPTLSKTPQGNALIIEGFKRVAQRKIEIAKMAREYKAAKGRFDEGFYDLLEQRFGGQDLLGDLYDKAASVAPAQGGGVLRFDANGNPV